jgi:hypothetical protein
MDGSRSGYGGRQRTRHWTIRRRRYGGGPAQAIRRELLCFLIRDHDRKFKAVSMPYSTPNTSESFGRRFTYPRQMGSQGGSSAPLGQNAWMAVDPERAASGARADCVY